jgi:hypothetical protein
MQYENGGQIAPITTCVSQQGKELLIREITVLNVVGSRSHDHMGEAGAKAVLGNKECGPKGVCNVCI